MRLFGNVDGVIDHRDAASLGFLPPFVPAELSAGAALRLFGIVDDAMNRFDRATFGFLAPFSGYLALTGTGWVNSITTSEGSVVQFRWRPRQRFHRDRRKAP
jgi:hypothetical protein